MRIKCLNILVLTALVLGIMPFAATQPSVAAFAGAASSPRLADRAATLPQDTASTGACLTSEGVKGISDTLIYSGEQLTYTIVLTPGLTAQVWNLYDPLPAGLTFVEVNGAGYNPGTHSISWTGPLGTGTVAVWQEGFEGAFPPPGWNLYTASGVGWEQTLDRTYSGTYSTYHATGTGAQDGWLITPQIQVPAGGGALSFWEFVLPNKLATRSLWVCTADCAAPPTNWSQVIVFPNTHPDWDQLVVSLDAYAGQEIHLAFRYQGLGSREWFIDDVVVEAPVDIPSHTITLVLEGDLPGYYTNVASVETQGLSCLLEAPELRVLSTAGFSLDVSIVGSGIVMVDPVQDAYFHGEVVTLTATANPDWLFAGWSGDAGGSEQELVLTIEDDTAVTATFVMEAYTLDVDIVGSGDVAVDPDKPTYVSSDTVTLKATADLGWSFASWSGDASGTLDEVTIGIEGDTVVTATFTQDAYTLDVTIAGSGDVAVDPDQPTYAYGDTVTLKATADPGWSFAGWSGDAGGTLDEVTITIEDDTTVAATFTQDAYTLDVTIVGSGDVAVDPDQPTYAYGDTVTLKATASPDWLFEGWSGGANGVLDEVTITLTGDTMITATFVPQPDLFATKVVAPVAGVDLGDTVTYTITLANTGDITASGIILRDVLPEGVVFRAFVPNSGAVHNAGIITWSGALSTGNTLTLIFTATVADDASLYNKAITNVITFTSTNAGSGSAEATFTVKQQYKIMLPLVIRN